MLDASERTGMKLTIGYQSRWRADSLYLKKMCEDGELGEIYYGKAIALRRRAVPTWGVFLNEYEQGGGPLIDIGTHALDLTLWKMDNYKPKSSKIRRIAAMLGATGIPRNSRLRMRHSASSLWRTEQQSCLNRAGL